MTTTASPPAPAPPKAPRKTSGGYLVLRKVAEQWQIVTTSNAKSAEAAVKKLLESAASGERDGTFVAIPARSWRPVKVSTKTETKLIVEDAR